MKNILIQLLDKTSFFQKWILKKFSMILKRKFRIQNFKNK